MTVVRWATFLSLIAFAYVARVVFIPVFLSVFLAMLFEPVVASMVNRGFRRQTASTVVVTTFCVVAAAALWFVYLSTLTLLNDLTTSPRIGALANYIQSTAGSFDVSSLLPSKLGASEIQKVEVVQAYPAWMGFLMTGFGSLFEVLSVSIFVPLLLFYFLFDKENLVESLNSLLGESLYLPTLNSELPNMIQACGGR